MRLIGVDAPETVHPQRGKEVYGKEASAYTRSLVEGRTVYSPSLCRSRYGRLLACTYLDGGRSSPPVRRRCACSYRT